MFRWTVHVNGGPKGSHCAAAAVQHEVYAFEHRSYNYNSPWTSIHAHVFNTESLCWRKLTTVTTGEVHPLPRSHFSSHDGHTAVLIGYIIYIWGGCRPYSNMLYAFDVDTHSWFKPRVSGTVPEGRTDHSACVFRKVMYIHGGYADLTGGRTRTNDIYKLDTTTMVWSFIYTRGTPPPASSEHSATIIGTKMFVFGGERDHNHIGVFDTEANCWLNTTSAQLCPGLRCWLRSSFAYNGELYIISGDRRGVSELWKFNPETFSWTKVEPKGKGPSWSSMRCCMVGDRIILFGGFYSAKDLQILDLSPTLKTLCKLAVIQYGVKQSELPHDIRWELRAMTTNSKRQTLFMSGT